MGTLNQSPPRYEQPVGEASTVNLHCADASPRWLSLNAHDCPKVCDFAESEP